MKSNKKIFILAVLIGLITVIGLNYYLSDAHTEGRPRAAVEMTSVVVPQVTIPQHTRITGDMLMMEEIHSEAVHPEAVRDMDQVVGGISRSDIVRGEQVLTTRFTTEEMRASLSYRVPENYRAIAIPVGDVSGVSGYISPGDRVDVLVTYSYFHEEADEEEGEEGELDTGIITTYTTVQNVEVLAAEELTHEQDDEERRVVGTITLLANPEQAEVLAYATQQGSFHLTLRSPLDEEIIDLDYYNIKNFETFRER